MRFTRLHRNRLGWLAMGCLLVGGLAGTAAAQAPVSSAFTYQARLSDASGPLDGTADLIVTMFNTPSDGAIIGAANSLNNIPVTDGLITVSLDFGMYSVASDGRWLEFAVRSPAGSGSYTTLSPRQPLTAAPVAWYAMRPWRPTTEGGLSLELPSNAGQVNGVGVGTGLLMPVARLHVRTGAFFPAEAVRIEDVFGRSQLRLSTPESEGRATLQAWNGQANAAGSLSLNVGGGNVGIGTSTPSSRLDVAGTFEADGFKLNGNGAAAGKVLMSDASGSGTWQSPVGTTQWTTNGSHIGYLGSGNVGIGTTSPHANFRFQTTGGSGAWRGGIAATGTTNSAVMGEANGVATIGGHNAALSAWSNLAINPNGGNVGIGTHTPSHRLSVAGTLHSTDTVSTNGNVMADGGLVAWGNALIGGDLSVSGELSVGGNLTVQAIEFPNGTVQTSGNIVFNLSRGAFTVARGGYNTYAFTVSGAAVGNAVVVSPPVTLNVYDVIAFARVSAANTVQFRIKNCNPDVFGDDSSYAAGTWAVTVIK